MIFTLAANNISQRSHFDKKIHFNIYIASPEGIYFDDGYADCMAKRMIYNGMIFFQ